MTAQSSTQTVGEARGPTVSVSPSDVASATDDPDLQRVWFSTQALDWRSLALVPASDDVSVLRIARAFAQLGFRERGESIGVADLRGVLLPDLRRPIEAVQWHVRRGERVIVVLRPCFQSVATVALARAADCAILCVALGTTRIADANDTVAQIGSDPFIGTLLVRRGEPGRGAGRSVPRLRAMT